MRELHLFAGCGGGILGGMLLGHTCVCAVEIRKYRRAVLFQRQKDGVLPPFPIWDDVRTFDSLPWIGRVDIVAGGFPCQDISIAGRGKGINGERSGLWSEMFRVVCEIRPRIVFVENSPMLVSRGLGRILGDLAKAGYDAEWGVFAASDLGFLHERQRLFVYAYNHRKLRNGEGTNPPREVEGVPKWMDKKNRKNWRGRFDELEAMDVVSRISSYADGRRISDGFPNGMDRYSAIGDGQVPAVVKLAWETLSQ